MLNPWFERGDRENIICLSVTFTFSFYLLNQPAQCCQLRAYELYTLCKVVFYILQTSPKKMRIDRPVDTANSKIADSLKACTSNQLIGIIEKLVSKRPELEKVGPLVSELFGSISDAFCSWEFTTDLFQDLKDVIPKPDLRPLEVHLTYLKRNISKALPVNRLCSKTDAIAYHRAAAHLVSFKVRSFFFSSYCVK